MKQPVLTVLCLCVAIMAMAQKPRKTITIKGTLIDSASKTPLGYVSVAVNNAATQQQVKGLLSKDDGSFEIDDLPAKPYKLLLAYIGYNTRIIAISGKPAIINLGKINLISSTNNLTEVSITADKPIIKQEVDRISYDIQADPENKVLSVLDMLRKVPLISLDADDNILLKGSGDYKILINGKPSSLVVHSPKDIFRAMPASSIQKIEVITTPPAKYDSDGLAGIINIITNKKIDNGYNGSININDRFPVGGPGLGGSFTYKDGKFGVASYYGLNRYNQPQTSNHNNRIATDNTDLEQSGVRKSNSKSGYIGTEFSYEIDTLNLITAEFNINGGNSNSQSNRSSITDSLNNVLQGYNIANTGTGSYNGYDVGLNYQLGFANKKNQLLTFSYKYNVSNSRQFNNLDIYNRINYPIAGFPDYRQDNKDKAQEHAMQLDYVQTIKALSIEAGIKGTIRNGDSNYEYDSLRYDPLNPGVNQYAIDTSLTNVYSNTQYILGAYNSYQYNFNNWGVKVGGRLEETIVNANFVSSTFKVDQNYFNFIPSISINRKLADLSSLNFGFTQRLSRPNISTLNPFVNRTNPNFESAGNPDLQPVVSNNFQLNYSRFKKGSINIGLSYSVASNTIQQISIFDPATGITHSTYDNIGKNRALGTNVNVNYPITKFWSFSLNGILNYLWINGTVNGIPTANSGVQGYFYTSTSYKFKNGIRVNANLNLNSPNISLQVKSNSYVYSAFSTSKEIIKNKLTLSASLTNPFTKFRTTMSQTIGSNFVQSNYAQNYLRIYGISLNYRFGKLKDAIRKNQRNNAHDDDAPVKHVN
jgi:outer membrane receptor protein involved in Fe transport